MERQEKISKFIRQQRPGAEIFDSSEFDIESIDVNQRKVEKKQPVILGFLSKFNKSDMEAMEKFIEVHKYQLSLPVRPKMGLFEDIYILYEFRKELEGIKADRVKTIEQICDKLQTILKRSKVTIKQRITKKISHCSVEEIMDAIKNKKDLIFDKAERGKKVVQISSKSNQDIEHPKIKMQSSDEMMERTDIRREVHIQQVENDSRHNFNQQIGDQSFNNLSGTRIYKYGKKQNQRRTFIYVNVETKQTLPFTEQNFNDLKQRFGCNVPLPTMPKPAESSNNTSRNAEVKSESNPLNEISLPTEEELKRMPRQQLEEYIKNIKEKACRALNQADSSSTNDIHKKLVQGLEKIEELQTKLNVPNSNHQHEDIMTEILNVGQSPSKRSFDSTGKKTTEERSPMKVTDQTAQQKKLLYQLGNNSKYLSILKQDPSLEHKYIWTKEEDDILYNWRFNVEAYHNEMVCIMKYKGRQLLFQRMRFLNIDLTMALIDVINNLDRKPVEPAKENDSTPEELADKAPEEHMNHPAPEELMEMQ